MTERPLRDIPKHRSGNNTSINVDFRLIDKNQSNQFRCVCRNETNKRPYSFRGCIATMREIRLLRRARFSRHLKSLDARHYPGTAFVGHFFQHGRQQSRRLL